jgi:AraC-like DNA-binding protein/ligand-binding sensor protein
MQLEQLLSTVETLTGLEVSIYSADHMLVPESIAKLSGGYRRHMSAFCRLVKGSDRRGCKGHDSRVTNQRAGEVGNPFVQRCHAGIAEVIVPVFGAEEHLATVFIGQAVTEEVECGGILDIKKRLQGRNVDWRELEDIYADLPRMTDVELLRIGQFVSCALQSIVKTMSVRMFERQMQIQDFPHIRTAIHILGKERCWNISQSEMAERVNASVSYFSRLFKRIIGQTFTDYVTGLRIGEAQNLLHQTNLPVHQIARKLGYSRQSYFTNRFKDVTGMTPSQYRQNRRQGNTGPTIAS